MKRLPILPRLLTHSLSLIVGINIGLWWGFVTPSASLPLDASPTPSAAVVSLADAPSARASWDSGTIVKGDLATAWQSATTPGARQLAVAEAARINPEMALHWLTQHSEAASTDIVLQLAPRLPIATPSAAAPWIDALPEALRPIALQALIDHWSHKNPAACAHLLNHYHDLPAADSRVASYARILGRTDPSTAVQWARTLADSQHGRRLQGEILTAWLRRAPLAARHWIDHSSGATASEPTLWQDCLDLVATSPD